MTVAYGRVAVVAIAVQVMRRNVRDFCLLLI